MNKSLLVFQKIYEKTFSFSNYMIDLWKTVSNVGYDPKARATAGANAAGVPNVSVLVVAGTKITKSESNCLLRLNLKHVSYTLFTYQQHWLQWHRMFVYREIQMQRNFFLIDSYFNEMYVLCLKFGVMSKLVSWRYKSIIDTRIDQNYVKLKF